MKGYRLMCATALAAAALALVAVLPAFAAGSGDASTDILKRGGQLMSLRAGYAKGNGDVAPNGLVGAGFGYRRFVLNRWAFGGFMHYELLGRFGRAADISVPLTLEVTRHSRWGAAVYPYVGVGAGAFYHKQYRTGADESGFSPGRYLVVGTHTPVRGNRGLLGIDVRMAFVDKPDDNPVFPGPDPARRHIDDLLVDLREGLPLLFGEKESKTRTLWSVKIDYSFTY